MERQEITERRPIRHGCVLTNEFQQLPSDRGGTRELEQLLRAVLQFCVRVPTRVAEKPPHLAVRDGPLDECVHAVIHSIRDEGRRCIQPGREAYQSTAVSREGRQEPISDRTLLRECEDERVYRISQRALVKW